MTTETDLDRAAREALVRSEHEATHGEAEMCGAECIALGLADDYDHDDDPDCTWCSGEGEQSPCDDPLGCPGRHDKWGGGCPCRACGGTGLRSKQTVF